MSASMGPGLSAVLPPGLTRDAHVAALVRLTTAIGVPRLREWVVRWRERERHTDGAVELVRRPRGVVARWLAGAAAEALRAADGQALAGSHAEVAQLFPEGLDLVVPGLGKRRAQVEVGETRLYLAGLEEHVAELREARAEALGEGDAARVAWYDRGLAVHAFACEQATALSASWSRRLPG